MSKSETLRTESEVTLANPTLDMSQGSQSEVSQQSLNSTSSKPQMKGDNSGYTAQYHGAEAWWSVGEFLQQGITHQSVGLSLQSKQDDDTWDLSDSIADLYMEVTEREERASVKDINQLKEAKADVDREWIDKDSNNGFIRVFNSDSDNSRVFPCTLSTTAHKVCLQCGRPPNSLHMQLNGDIIKRLEPFDCPLAIQNEYLQQIGYRDFRKIQEMGSDDNLPWLVKFYAGKPISDSTYSRNQLTSHAFVRKGKLLYQWVRRLCVISGTRLLIYRDKNKNTKPTVVQLAKGSVEEISVKGHERCLKLTSTLQGDRSVYISFESDNEYSKWLRKTKKATAKLPSKADLSNCHLEFLPETVFINEDLQLLNLRHNALKERPIEEDIYTIGWLDDLPRFYNLRSLNLADNDLHAFPGAVCKIKTLTELNIASNKIREIPTEISELTNLQMLHVHNNHLTSLRSEMMEMKSLKIIVLAFNNFTTVPDVLLQSHNPSLQMESIIMAGNKLERLPFETLNKMQHVKKIDFRMNNLSLLPSEMAKFHYLEVVTHLDVRDNRILDLDVRSLKALEYLNCERNGMRSLQVNGMSLKNLLAGQNELETFSVNPKPEWIITLDIARNKLKTLPSWIPECFFMIKLDIGYNLIEELPERLFADAQKLKTLKVNHNLLTSVPCEVSQCVIEEMHLQHNQLTVLPGHLMIQATKMRYLNLTCNEIQTVPEFSFIHESRLQELYLSGNKLQDNAVPFLCSFSRIKILHLSQNKITEIRSRDVMKLEHLVELNVSGNDLRTLPATLGKHTKIQVLRANSNHLKELPDFKRATCLKTLEVGSNRLSDVSVTNLLASQVHLLDISGNPNIMVDTSELKGISKQKKICMIDMRGQNRSLLDLRQAPFESGGAPWQTGLSQTSGMRNKLSVSILNKPAFTDEVEGLFGMFDGGRNDEVTKQLYKTFSDTFQSELNNSISQENPLKYAMLAAHSKLRGTGQKVGAAAAVCHIKKMKENFVLNIANVGDTEVVLSRRGEAVPLSRLFLIQSDREECQRICKSDGIITEDGKVSGVTYQTRLVGSSYLYPQVIPDPHTTSVNLHPDDHLVVIANQGLWKYMSYQDVINQIQDIPDPVIAAKRLQDLAQGFGSKESIGVLVIRLLLSDRERENMRRILQRQYNDEQRLLEILKQRDVSREEEKKKRKEELGIEEENVPMDIVKLKKHAHKRMQAYNVFHEEAGDYVKLMNPSNSSSGDSSNWESVLQKRLAEDVKNKELMHMFVGEGAGSEELRNLAFEMGYNGEDTNWSTVDNEKPLKSKKKKKMQRRIVDPVSHISAQGMFKKHHENVDIISPTNYQPEASLLGPAVSVESVEFVKEYKMSTSVDRDAVLFHQMQLARAKSKSTDSLDSTQSVPMGPSFRDLSTVNKSSSHSIEVLIHNSQDGHHSNKENDIGGSHPYPIMQSQAENRFDQDYIQVKNSRSQLEDPILEKLERTLAVKFNEDEDEEEEEEDPGVYIVDYFSPSDFDEEADNDKLCIQDLGHEECNNEESNSVVKPCVNVINNEHSHLEKSEIEKKECEKEVIVHIEPHSLPEDTSVVSAYKKSPTLREKRKAPSPPIHRPPLPARQKEKRAPPPPQSIPPPRPPPPVTRSLTPCQPDIVQSTKCSLQTPQENLYSQENAHPNPTLIAERGITDINPPKWGMTDIKPHKGEITDIKHNKGDVFNIRAKISDSEKDLAAVSGTQVQSANVSSDGGRGNYSIAPPLVQDINANSITSLENFYFSMGDNDSKLRAKEIIETKRKSLESLIQRSLSQQSVIETYL